VSEDANLFAQQEANRRRSTWLIVGFIVFFAWVGFGGDLAFGLLTADAPPDAYHHVVPVIGLFTTLAAGGICWYSWRFGAQRVLWSTGAWEIVEPATPGQRQLVNVVEEMAIASGIPKPKVYVVPDQDPNAFATGRDVTSASIAVKEGLLDALSRDELQAVVAHEIAHIRNLDVRLMTLLAGMVGAIALMSDGMGRMMRGGRSLGSGGRRSGGGGKGGANPLGLIVLVLWVITLIVAPVVSRILAMAVSRKREYLADASGAQFTRNPLALAAALEKLAAATAPTRSITRGAAHLCIVDPAPGLLSERTGLVADVLASHPPIEQRISRLRAMAYLGRTAAGSGSLSGARRRETPEPGAGW
jgi:heat shock protein HtpX